MHRSIVIALAAASALIAAPKPASASAPLPMAGVSPLPSGQMVRAADRMPMHLAIILRYRREGELRALVAAQGVAGSPLAHHPLSAAQFDAYFAPTVQTYAQTQAALVQHGMRIAHTYANRTLIDVVASARSVETTFATQIATVRRSDGTMRYLNVRPAYLPADLAGAVYGVSGFDAGAHLRPVLPAVRRAPANPNIAPGPPLQGPATGFGPEAYAVAYDFPVLHPISGAPAGTTYDGAQQGVALIANDDFNDNDLAGYLEYFGIIRTGPPTQRIRVNGGAQHNGIFSFITTLQAETLVGLSPGVVLNDYGIPELDTTSLLDAYDQVVSDDTSAVALSPVFDCEENTVPAHFPQNSDYLALQGTALGIVFVANAGNYNLGVECAQFTPSGDPHFVSVGATTLLVSAQGGYRLELASSGSAGGESEIFDLPSYQRKVPNVFGTRRNIPDIAFDGDPGSGAALYENAYWTGPNDAVNAQLGNELSAAIFTSLVAEWTQMHGAPLGEIHGDLYHAFLKYGYLQPKTTPLFHDITLGSGFAGPAKAGYDKATGIGSIDGWNFAQTAHL